jgi:hypothetical protein
MRYHTIAEATPAIRGIYPPVSVRQANRISQWADDLQSRTTHGNPEQVAISLFKATYAANGKRWQRRNAEAAAKPAPKPAKTPAKTAPNQAKPTNGNASARTAIGNALAGKSVISPAALATFWKIADGRAIKASEAVEPARLGLILVTPQNTIQLTNRGRAVISAANANDAQAALSVFAPPSGMKENVMEPKTLTAAEPELMVETATISPAAPDGDPVEIAEMLDETLRGYYVPWGTTSFQALRASREAQIAADEMRVLAVQYQRLMENIMSSDLVTDKIAALNTLHDEFIGLLKANAPLPDGETDPVGDYGESLLRELPVEPLPDGMFYMREVAAPFDIGAGGFELAESVNGATPTLSYLNAQVIVPGWGNRKDNHFYPAPVLKRDAARFIGAKMYETDHKAADKNNRTWVSTITDIVGFTEAGAPIARIAIHDPNFSERVKNLNAAKILDKLQCSILAGGKARPNYSEGGRVGRLVESIDEVESVDWVTRAGAGGQALALVENNKGGSLMEPNGSTPNGTPAPVTTPAATPPVATPPAVEPTITQETFRENVNTPAPVTTPARVAQDRVRTLLAESRLPVAAQEKLFNALYFTEDEVAQAVNGERRYLAEITGSGRPIGMGESSGGSAAQPTVTPEALAEVEKAKNAVNDKYLGRTS